MMSDNKTDGKDLDRMFEAMKVLLVEGAKASTCSLHPEQAIYVTKDGLRLAACARCHAGHCLVGWDGDPDQAPACIFLSSDHRTIYRSSPIRLKKEERCSDQA